MMFLRAIETADGRWSCRRGTEMLDPSAGAHQQLHEAVAHLRQLAASIEGTIEIIVHFVDGEIRRLGEEEASPG